MSTPQNDTWRSGLLRLVPLSRGQVVEVPQSQMIEIVVYKVRDTNQPLYANNLIPQGLLRPGGPPFRVPLIGANNYRCIAVDMAPRTQDFTLSLQSNQSVQGTIETRITYRVINTPEILNRNDVLSDLRNEAQRMVQRVAETRLHSQITLQELEGALQGLNMRFMGLHIERVIIPNSIKWPDNLIKDQRALVDIDSQANLQRHRDYVDRETERAFNNQVLRDLQVYHVTDPAIVMYVLAHAREHNNIMEAIEMANQQQRQLSVEERNQAIARLNSLIENDLVDRTQLEDYIGVVIGDVSQTQRGPQPGSMPQIGAGQPGYYDPHYQIGPGQNQTYLDSGYPPPYNQPPPASEPGYLPPPTPRPLVSVGNANYAQGRAYLEVLSGQNLEIWLAAGITHLGRHSQENEIVIRDMDVSRHQAVIEDRAGHLLIRNQKSGIQTYVNNRSIGDGEVELNDGDEIIIGRAHFRLVMYQHQPLTGNPDVNFDEDQTRLS